MLPVFIILLLVIIIEISFILFYSNKDLNLTNNNFKISPPLTPEPTKVQSKSTNGALRDPTFESMVKNGVVKSSYLVNKIETKLISIKRRNNPELLLLTIKNGDGKVTYMYDKSQLDKITVFNNINEKINIENLMPGDDIEMVFEFDMLHPESDIRALKIKKF